MPGRMALVPYAPPVPVPEPEQEIEDDDDGFFLDNDDYSTSSAEAEEAEEHEDEGAAGAARSEAETYDELMVVRKFSFSQIVEQHIRNALEKQKQSSSSLESPPLCARGTCQTTTASPASSSA